MSHCQYTSRKTYATRFTLPFIVVLALMAQLIIVFPAAAAPVDPASVNLTIPTGGSAPPITKTVHPPIIPPKSDLVLLADTTGSMGPAIANVKAGAATIMGNVRASDPDSQFGAASYKDFNCDAKPYSLDQAVTADTTAVQNGINTWSAGGGCDTPESQLNALFQLATDPATGFRSGSTRNIAWFGDSSGHDPSNGHTLADAIAALQAAHIRVIAVPVNTGLGNGLDSTGQATAIANATGGVVIPAASPDAVTDAILAGLMNQPVTVTTALGACSPGLSVTLTPTSPTTVTNGDPVTFSEVVAVAANAPFATTLTCQVNFLLNGNLTTGFTEAITVNVPKHDTKLTLGSATTSDFNDPVTVSATLIDAALGTPIGGVPITLGIDGQSCAATTAGTGVGSCSITPNEPAGSYPLTAAFAGNGQYNASNAAGTFVVTLEETTLAITSSNTLATGAVNVSAVLKEDGTTPISGRTVTFSAGGLTANGTTNGSGVASATLALAPGAYTLNANFAGDTFYKPSAAAAQTLFVFQTTQFVIWGGNAPTLADAVKVGQDYNFWGAQWDKQVTAGDYQSNGSFKGFAEQVSGAAWTSDPGNASDPPASVATYIGVIVSTHIAKNGSVESGNVAEVVVLKVDNPAGYQPNPGHPGSGVMVAVVH
jgi:Big-like domain-containing protein